MPDAVEIRLNKPQAMMHRRLRPGMTLCPAWGRGVGKSWWDLTMILLLVAEYDGRVRANALEPMRGIRIVLMLPSFKQAKDLYALKLEQALGPSGKFGFLGARIDRVTWRIRFPGGSWLQLFGAENARGSRGLRCDVVVVDDRCYEDAGFFV